mmetsp:Transcript_10341/g.36304  ORF Transcript_10341/g.36304 Transcript_10341/m.36304 type:complete len:336 (-) Transcript_10341:6-1013(-)
MRSRTLHLLAADGCQPPHARVLVNLGFRLCECLCECLLLCPFRLQLCLASLRFRRFGLTLGCLCRGCLANRLECLFLRGAGLLQRCDLGLEPMCSRDLRMQSLLLRLQLATQRRGVGLERLCSRDLRQQGLLFRLQIARKHRGVGLERLRSRDLRLQGLLLRLQLAPHRRGVGLHFGQLLLGLGKRRPTGAFGRSQLLFGLGKGSLGLGGLRLGFLQVRLQGLHHVLCCLGGDVGLQGCLFDVVEFARHRGASIFGIFQLAAELLDVRILHNLLLDILVLKGDLRARWRLVRRRLQLLLCLPLGLVLLAMSTVHRSRSVKARGAVCAFQDLLGRL